MRLADLSGVDVCEKAQQKLRPGVKRLGKWKEKSKRDGERIGGEEEEASRVGLSEGRFQVSLCSRLLAFHWPLSGLVESCPSPVYLIYSHECFACISDRVPRICLVPEEARNGHWVVWTGVRDGRKLPCGCWQLNPGSPQKQ